MNTIFEQLYVAYLNLKKNENVLEKMQDFSSINHPLIDKIKTDFGASNQFCELYENSDGYSLKWKKDPETSIGGRISILKLQHFLDGIKVQEPHLTESDELFYFHPIDLFSDEAHCGVFIKDGKIQDRMFFHRFGEDEVSDLKLTFNNYLQLASMARGYFYWPKYILSKITGSNSQESDNFQKNMPEIFPDFNLADFDAKWEELKLS